jgi:transcriptional regulator with XRE-family HTH domain
MRTPLDLRRHASSGQAAHEDRLEEELTRLTLQVTDEITWQMRTLGLSRADLAARMGVSPGRVSQVLSGGENFTLRTIVGLAAAVGARFDVQLHPENGDSDTSQHQPMESATSKRRPVAPSTHPAVSMPQELASARSARNGIRPGPQGPMGR